MTTLGRYGCQPHVAYLCTCCKNRRHTWFFHLEGGTQGSMSQLCFPTKSWEKIGLEFHPELLVPTSPTITNLARAPSALQQKISREWKAKIYEPQEPLTYISIVFRFHAVLHVEEHFSCCSHSTCKSQMVRRLQNDSIPSSNSLLKL